MNCVRSRVHVSTSMAHQVHARVHVSTSVAHQFFVLFRSLRSLTYVHPPARCVEMYLILAAYYFVYVFVVSFICVNVRLYLTFSTDIG